MPEEAIGVVRVQLVSARAAESHLRIARELQSQARPFMHARICCVILLFLLEAVQGRGAKIAGSACVVGGSMSGWPGSKLPRRMRGLAIAETKCLVINLALRDYICGALFLAG